jgi:hypothetical protein
MLRGARGGAPRWRARARARAPLRPSPRHAAPRTPRRRCRRRLHAHLVGVGAHGGGRRCEVAGQRGEGAPERSQHAASAVGAGMAWASEYGGACQPSQRPCGRALAGGRVVGRPDRPRPGNWAFHSLRTARHGSGARRPTHLPRTRPTTRGRRPHAARPAPAAARRLPRPAPAPPRPAAPAARTEHLAAMRAMRAARRRRA